MDGGHVGQRAAALGNRNTDRFHPAGIDLRQRSGNGTEQQVHFTADQSDHRRRAAFIRHVHHVDAGHGSEKLHGKMGHVAESARSERQLFRFRFGKRDQTLHVVHRKARMHHQHRRADGNQAERREILAHVKGKLHEQTRNGNRRVCHEHGVTVGGCFRHDFGRDIARGTGAVVDDEGTAEGISEFQRDGTRRNVGRSARLEADHDAHGFCGILLGDRRARMQSRHTQAEYGQKLARYHAFPSRTWARKSGAVSP